MAEVETSEQVGEQVGEQATTVATPGVATEVGRLRTVMLHRPGNELRRLTPRNNDALLFDGLPWVDRAQEEHDAFAEALRSHGVEVLYLADLLAETLEVAEGRTAGRIGEELHLSEATVKTHLHNLYEKLGVSDRAAAVATAMRWGLLE